MKRIAATWAPHAALGLFLARMILAPIQPWEAAPDAHAGAPTANEATASEPSTKASFLPDSAVLARVNKKLIRVFDFRDGYFATPPAFRPAGDSAGRVEFLESMVNKEVLAIVARQVNKPLTMEDRLALREHTATVLTNTLYMRVVEDSLNIGEKELKRVYEQFAVENRLRHIHFADRETAERVYRELKRGRITWSQAVREYSLAPDKDRDGEIGWTSRLNVTGDVALKMFDLEPGGISPPALDTDGYHIAQLLEQRRVQPPPFSVCRRRIESDLRLAQTPHLMARFFARLRARGGAVYDTTEIRWAVDRFREAALEGFRPGDPTLGNQVPVLAPEDERRILARLGDRELTLGEMISGYQAIPSLMRRDLLSWESFTNMMDAIFLHPELVEYARLAGMEHDPYAAPQIEKFREKLIVEHLYRDSIQSKVVVTPAQMRKYYDEHPLTYYIQPRVRYANLIRPTEASADSVLALLRAGVDAASIIRADSLTGWTNAAIGEVSFNEPGPLVRVLFEDLRPPEATKLGPTSLGLYLVLQCLEYIDGRQPPFDEVESEVAAAVRASHEETLLLEFLAKHRAGHEIELHPERVMRIRLVDPALDQP